MLYAIWYHLYTLKNVKNSHGGVLTYLNLVERASMNKKNLDRHIHYLALPQGSILRFAFDFWSSFFFKNRLYISFEREFSAD